MKTSLINKIILITSMLILFQFTLNISIEENVVHAYDPIVITNPDGEYVKSNTLYVILEEDFNESRTYEIRMSKMEPSESVFTSMGATSVTTNNNTLPYSIPIGMPSNTKFQYDVRVLSETGVWSAYSAVKSFTYVNVNSSNISVYPLPDNKWSKQAMDINVFFEGEPELLEGAIKRYAITTSSTPPTTFTNILPDNGYVTIGGDGERYLHIEFEMSYGSVISETAGPYKIDTSGINDFTVSLKDSAGNTVTDWHNGTLTLDIVLPAYTGPSELKRQYRIEGYHSDWVTYNSGTQIPFEGKYRVFTRVINNAGSTSATKDVIAKIDKTVPVFNYINLTESTDGSNTKQYAATAIVAKDLSGISYVEVSTSEQLVKNGSTQEYSKTNISTKPTYIRAFDNAGNSSGNIPFLDIPEIIYANGYSPTQTISREAVQASLSGTGTISYQFGKRSYFCEINPCDVTIENNTLFTAINTKNNIVSRKIVSIDNIDKDPVRLVLNAERSSASVNEILFEWNYNLSNPTLTCDHSSGVITLSPSPGTSYLYPSAENYTYACNVSGTVYGVYETSNTITVYPDYKKDLALPTGGNISEKELQPHNNIQYEESLLGKTYFINTNKNNLDNKTIPLPDAIFGL